VKNAVPVKDTGAPDVSGGIIGIGFHVTDKTFRRTYSQPLLQLILIRHYALHFNDVYRTTVTTATVLAAAFHATRVIAYREYVIVYIVYRQSFCPGL
jgi:predicted membrane-bound dolichyl-phosphate-mannose-protein mannosyltransferase